MADGFGDGASWRNFVVKAPQEYVTEESADFGVVVERGLRIPMRDGIELGAMLWRPQVVGSYPALVERSPLRLEERTGSAGDYYAARGYVVVSVGMRGCSGSGGEFTGSPPGARSGDGYDTIEWVAAQPWCNGVVGTICGSISGYTSYQSAVEAPPHLKPIFVREGPFLLSLDLGGAIPIEGLSSVAAAWTAHQLENYPPELRQRVQKVVRNWRMGIQSAIDNSEPISPFMPVHPSLLRLPLCPSKLFTGVADYYNDWVVAPRGVNLNENAELSDKVDGVQIPICHFGAWFDGIILDTLAAFTTMSQGACTMEARQGQRLIIGPWVHGPAETHGKPVGQLEFGPNAELDFHGFRRRWYDVSLKQKGSVGDDPVVWIYLVGADRWLGFEAWPPPQSKATPWYLDDGKLASAPPEDLQGGDSYEYDPREPVPSLSEGGAMAIGADQRPIEDRLLKYTSAPLPRALTLIGEVKIVLYAASSALDTDWVVRLTMVRPDGASVIISGGVLRARFRHSFDQPELLTPNQVERFEVDLLPISMVIPANASLRVTVTSSDFPMIDRNLNTGGPIAFERRGKKAINTVYHDATRPSHVLLPIFGWGD